MFIVSPPSQNFFLESFGSQQRADLWCDHRHCSPRCCTRPPPSPRSDESTPTSSAAGGRWPVAETFRRRCRRTRGSSARSGQRLTQRQRQWLRQRRQRHQRNASNDKSDLRRLRPRLRPQLTHGCERALLQWKLSHFHMAHSPRSWTGGGRER